MKTLQFIGSICMGMLALRGAKAQQPTAYIPASPLHSSSPARCTPPPGATCTPSNQTSTTSRPHFLPTYPPSLRIPPPVIPQILPLLSSLTLSWAQAPSYTTLCSALYALAPASAQSSLSASGYNFQSIVASDWYQNVSEEWKSEVQIEAKVLQKAFDGLTGNVESGGNVGRGRGVDGEVLVWVLVFAGWIVGLGLL